jgi:hypothetical protein
MDGHADFIAALVSRSIRRAFDCACPPPRHDATGAVSTTDLSDEDDDETPLRTAPPSPYGSLLRNAPRHGPSVAAWHGAIPLESHRNALEADASKLVGKTFWVGAGDRPTCSLERLALGVLRFHVARWTGEPHVLGAEWWVQVRRSDGTPTIPLHWDSDEEHKATSGEHAPPWRATVTYLGSRGAPTVVLPVAADAHGRAVRAGADAYISYPVAGKHLCFDGRLLHGALHELSASYGAGQQQQEYVRTSILVNLWTGHAPDAERLPLALASELSNLDDVLHLDPSAACDVTPIERHPGSTAVLTEDAGWRKLRVGYTPCRGLVAKHTVDEWRALVRLVGFPFCHPDVSVRRLPWGGAGPHPPSIVRVSNVGLLLPFENDSSSGSSALPSTTLVDYEAAGLELVHAAAKELNGEWRAARTLRRLLPRLTECLPPSEDGDEDGASEEEEGGVVAIPQIGGEAALLHLASMGLWACALCILSQPGHRRIDLDVNAGDADGFTALHYAATLNLVTLVRPLLEHGANLHATTRDVASLREPGGRTPLHLAAAAGNVEIVKLLLDAGADVTLCDWQGATPSHLAHRRGHSRLAAQLSEGGADSLPSEQELVAFELAEGIAMRERNRLRLSIEERPPLHTPFVLPHLLPSEQCLDLVKGAERLAASRGWHSKRHRHYATVDMPLSDLPHRLYIEARAAIDDQVLPNMRRSFSCRPLRVREAFLVKYEADGLEDGVVVSGAPGRRQAGLGMHRDGTLLNCVILLSNPSDFAGGGTVFAPPLDKTYHIARGDCLCSSGQLLHGARPVTGGTRFVLVAFIDELQEEAMEVEEGGEMEVDWRAQGFR